MKVLFNHALPFALAHGGFQTQIEETKAALERRGVEVEHLRWWDDTQRGDLIHHFVAPPVALLNLSHERGIPSVVTHLFSATCNRSPLQLKAQGLITQGLLLKLPGIKNQLSWQAFRQADRMAVGLEAERRVLEVVGGIPSARIATLPLGLHPDFLAVGKPSRSEPHLISTGTITYRKGSVELAKMARAAEVPILFVGKPFDGNDPYWHEFRNLIDDRFVFHRDHVSDRLEMIRLLQSSRGFVMFSLYENWCLSAHEAAACGIPLLVKNQIWAQERFGQEASYLHPAPTARNAGKLRAFYDRCPQLPAPRIRLYSWDDTAEKLEACYRELITSR